MKNSISPVADPERGVRVKFPAETWRDLHRLAEARGVSVTKLVTQLVVEFTRFASAGDDR